MALKSITAQVVAKPANKKEAAPETTVKGNAISRYVKAYVALKDAKAVVDELRPFVLKDALKFMFNHNSSNPKNPASTVKVGDAEEVVRVSFQNKYSVADAESVDSVFSEFGKDINTYAQETIKVAFDSKVFLDAEGNTRPEVYEAFRTACEAVATKMKVANPLSSKVVVLPKPNFHEDRWTDFTAEQNARLTEVLPNTVTITPLKSE